jgi:hypothetical protein
VAGPISSERAAAAAGGAGGADAADRDGTGVHPVAGEVAARLGSAAGQRASGLGLVLRWGRRC